MKNRCLLFYLAALILCSVPARAADTLIPLGAFWKYLDNGSDQGTAWRQPGFDDSSWSSGRAELGYGDNDEATVISFGGVSSNSNKHITYYFRRSFDVPNPAAYALLRMQLKRDDGAVVYLNGVEIHRANIFADPVLYSTRAQNDPDDGRTLYQLTAPTTNLLPGANVIAVEVHQDGPTSSDVSFNFELVGSENNPPTVAIDSPGNGARFTAPANIQIRATGSDIDANLALVELFSGNVKLAESSGSFVFQTNNVSIGSYSFYAIATDAFGLRATSSVVNIFVDPSTPPVIASRSPAPGNVTSIQRINISFSEPVTGIDASDLLINGLPATSVTGTGTNYLFEFPQPADGIVLVTWNGQHNIADLENPPRAFDAYAPGATWQYTLADSVAPITTGILPSPGATLRKLDRIQITFSEPVTGIDPADLLINGAPATSVSGHGAGPYEFAFAQPAASAITIGWSPTADIRDTSNARNLFTGAPWTYTLSTNASYAGQIVINEINHHPATERDDHEWIELHNRSTNSVNLAGWAFSRGVDFTFPAVTMSPGAYLVIAADTNAFRIVHPGVNALGNWNGRLSNTGEDIELEDANGDRIDLVSYADQGEWGIRRRWTISATGLEWIAPHDGDGSSLELRNAALENNTGQNWTSSLTLGGTPGAVNSTATNNLAPLILDAAHFPIVPRSTNAISITARLVDESATGLSATLFWRNASITNAGTFNSTTMFDDGGHGDGAAGDGVFGATLAAQTNRTVIEYYVQASDAGANLRTWPAPVRETNGTTAQVANALLQVDDENYSGNQPVYRLVMTERDRVTFNGLNRNIEDEMNVTFIATELGRTDLRHNASLRYRGAGSRGRNPPTMRLNFRSDEKWHNKSALNLNSQAPHSQVIGSQLSVLTGHPSEYARAVQLRMNGVNLATSAMFGSYAAVEATNGETVGEHLPDDGDGNVYRASTGAHSATLNYLGTNPTTYFNAGYSKTSNKTENNWSDLMALTFAMDPATTPDSDYLPALRRNMHIEQWLRYFAMCSIMEYTETSLGSGSGDDYGLYSGVLDPRFYILPHDFDTIFNQGDTAGNVSESIYVATAVGTVSRFLFHPEINPLYQAELRRLLATTYSTNQLFARIDQFLGDWVAPATITAMKNFIIARNANILAQLGPEPAALPLATLSGEPTTPTYLNNASLTVGGTGITHYRWRLNGSDYSAETPVATPITLANLADGTYTVSVIGRDSAGTWQSTNAPTYSGTWTVLSNLRRVLLNEILARNDTATTINGGHPDLIELHNPRATTVDLTGLRITDDLNTPNRFIFPAGTTIPAGGYLTLIAANADGSPGLYLGFNLDADGETIHLLDSVANGGAVLDTVEFGLQLPDLSIGRDARGQWTLCTPTFGTANTPVALGDPANLRINEWLASGVAPLADDFVELYNSNNLPVALGGLYLSDLPGSRPFTHRLTPLSYLPALGYRAFTADGQPERGSTHLNFQLGSSIGEIGLLKADGTIIDFVVYAVQRSGVSQGRVPNGGLQIKFLTPPTPGAPNPVPATPPQPITVNLLALNDTVQWRYDQSGTDFGTGWTARNFDDSTWPQGAALLAREDFGVAPEPIRTVLTVASGRITYYFRTRFNLPVGLSMSELQAGLVVDDGAVIHINGVEAGRFNLPTGTIGFNTQASSSHEATAYETVTLSLASLVPGENVIAVEVHQQGTASSDVVFGLRLDAVILTNSPTSAGIRLNEVLANNQSVTNADGSATDWVELRNPSNTTVDLAGMSLTDTVDNPRRWVFPAGSIIAANSQLVVRFDDTQPASTAAGVSLNTGFGLNASGDEVYLFNQPGTGGELLDAVVFGIQAPDLSIGRDPVTGTNWIATIPTPGSDNIAASLGNPALVRINEWMANPSSGDDWIELFNANPQAVAIGGLSITDDLNDRSKNPFPPLSFMAAGSRAHLRLEADNNPGAGANHLSFKLSGDGESIGLFGAAGELIDSISFGAQIEGVSQGRLPDGSALIVSFPGHATPGDANFLTLADIFINEVLTHSTPPREDAIEIHNAGINAVDISGWYLSDSQNSPLKFQIPANTIIPAGGFVVFYENQFNAFNTGTPFSLSSTRGDEVFLSQSTAPATLSGYRASVSFGAAADGISFGRYLTSVGADFTAMSQTTFGEDTATTVEGFRAGTGQANSAPLVGPVVISEIMYHPPDVIAAGVTNDNELDEFIELRNLSASPVPLFDGASAWRLRDAVDFEFPTNFTLAADSRIVVVSFDPATNATALASFRAHYGIDNSVILLGPWRGRLANNSENIELYRPGTPVADGLPDAGLVPFILMDRVKYSDTLPWPSLADGSTNGGVGLSLQRRFSAAYGNDPVSWLAAAPTPGTGNGLAAIIPPGITSFTPAQAVAPGGSVTLTVAASGGGTLTYEWRKNGNVIAGATAPSLTVSSFQSASVGTYSVIVANGAGSASASTQLELGAAPVIARPPSNQIVEPGGTAAFSVLASGTGPLGYQWQRSFGSAIWETLAGANSASLTLAGVQLADASAFRAIVTNAFGSVTSSPATLSIVSPPVIVTQPVGTNILVGQNAGFFVVAGGTAPFRYQWLFNNTTEIPGATNASLLLTNLPAQATGSFSVRVSNAIGSVTSSNAALLVEPPPSAGVAATDNVATEPGTGAPTDTASFTFTRTKVTDQPQEIFFTVSGSATPGVDYVALASPVLIPAGSNSVTLTLTPLNDSQAESNEFVIVTVVAGPGYVPGDSPVAVAAIVDDDNQRPVVTITSPTNNAVTVFPGNVAISATASDPDGSITRVEFYANGTNRLGEDLTAPYGIIWTNAPLGVNFIVALATDNLGATVGVATQFIMNNAPAVTLTAPQDGAILSPGGDITLAASATDSDGTIALVEFFADAVRLGSDATQPYRLTWTGVPEGIYNLTAQATDNRGTVRVSNPVKITVGLPPPVFGDAFSARGIVAGYTNTIPGTNLSFTREPGEPRHASRSGNHSGWMSWTAPASGLCRVDTFGSEFDTLLAVYTGGTVSNLTVVTANDDANGDTILSAATFNATGGVTYHFAVDGYGTNGTILGGNAGRMLLNIALPNPYPVFTTQPRSLVVTQGNTATFSASVHSPTNPVTFRWRFNGTNISGANGTNLALNNVQATQAGSYTLVASNSAGTATSAVAVLIVQGPPLITSQPQPAVIPGGGTAAFTVSATGTGPLTYQWQYNGTDISGATSNNLVLQNVQGRQEGLYSVIVTSPLGVTPSTSALLTVDDGLRVNRFDLLFNETKSWRYHAQGGNLGTTWRFPGYDDAGWSNGTALFGLEAPDVYQWSLVTPLPLTGTNGSGTITFYFRTSFTLPSPVGYTSLAVEAYVDDGAVWYINGREGARLRLSNAIAVDGMTSTTTASSAPEGQAAFLTLPLTNAVAGENLLSVEVHQQSSTSSDVVFGMALYGSVALTNGPSLLPPLPNGSGTDVTLNGISGRDYALEVSTNLVNWSTAATWTNFTGSATYLDPATPSPGNGTRFYRGRLVR